MSLELHVVLVEPEIPQNAGNIARTCACIGATLHLVEPMGFHFTQRNVARAGLDYWDKVEIRHHASAQAFFDVCADDPKLLFTGRATASFHDAVLPSEGRLFLVFGRESRGLDDDVLERFASECVRIPMREGLRSLNLSNAVALSAYEVMRRGGFEGLA